MAANVGETENAWVATNTVKPCLLFIFFFIFFDDFENGLLVASYSFKGPELGGSLYQGERRMRP